MRRLEDKVILIAGAGGIGEGLALRYAQEGAAVVLGDIDLASAARTVREIEESGGRATAIHLDGADEESVNSAVESCLQVFGGLDGLHANFASLADSNREQGVLELSLDVYDQTQNVNVRGYYLCTRKPRRKFRRSYWKCALQRHRSNPGQVARSISHLPVYYYFQTKGATLPGRLFVLMAASRCGHSLII